jgi:hypothetical protein
MSLSEITPPRSFWDQLQVPEVRRKIQFKFKINRILDITEIKHKSLKKTLFRILFKTDKIWIWKTPCFKVLLITQIWTHLKIIIIMEVPPKVKWLILTLVQMPTPIWITKVALANRNLKSEICVKIKIILQIWVLRPLWMPCQANNSSNFRCSFKTVVSEVVVQMIYLKMRNH